MYLCSYFPMYQYYISKHISYVGSFANLVQSPGLEIVNLHGNSFSGSIPTDLFGLTGLTYLFLSANSLTGYIYCIYCVYLVGYICTIYYIIWIE